MAETIGRVEFDVGLDGRGLPREARALGEKIGAAGEGAGELFGDKFSAALNKRLRIAGAKAAENFNSFSDGMRNVMRNALGNVQNSFRTLWNKLFRRKGKDMGDSFSAGFEVALRGFGGFGPVFDGMNDDLDRMSRNAHQLGIEGNKNVEIWGGFADDMGYLRQVFPELEGGARRLAIEGNKNVEVWSGLTEDIGELFQVFENGGGGGGGGGIRGVGDDFDDASRKGGGFRDILRDLGVFFQNLRGHSNGLNKSLNKQGSLWDNLGHNAKQWILIIGAVMAGMQELSVLGSALGAGIMALGGAFTSVIFGGLGLISVFSNLNQELKDAPDSMKEAIKSFSRFKTSIDLVSDTIAQSAFDAMGPAFDKLAFSVAGLTPAFSKLGTVIGNLFDDLAENTKIGTDGFAQINKAVENAGPNFDSLARSAGTFGLAMLRGFNKAQPLVEQMLGWIDKLVDRFDDFTKSPGFDEWIARAQSVFTHFGALLDAVGRSLNDLVTPGAVARTNAFLDNLTGFMPSLTSILEVAGHLDVFGLAAQALNQFGDALEPLAQPLLMLADALNQIISILIDEFAAVLGNIAGVIGPLVGDLANFIGAIPEPVIRGIADAVVALGIAFATFKAVTGIQTMTAKLMDFTAQLSYMVPYGGKVDKAMGKISGALGKAGLWAGIAAGIIVAVNALNQLAREIADVDGVVHDAIASNQSLIATVDELSGAATGVSLPLKDVGTALDELSLWQGGNVFSNIGAVFKQTGSGAHDLNAALGELGPSLAKMEPDVAAQKFAAYANELGATDEQAQAMLKSMGPEFNAMLDDAAGGADGVATAQEKLDFAMGRTTAAAEEATAVTELQAAALEALTGKAVGASGAIDGVSDAISAMGSVVRDQRGSARDYEAAIDDLTASIEENGNSLDIGSEKGRANQAALDDLAQSTLDLAGKTYEMTGSQEQATAAIQTGRDELIRQLGTFGIVGQEAEDYADSLGLIPGDVTTIIDANTEAGMLMADGFASRMYELGLLEVDPTVALNTAPADQALIDTAAVMESFGTNTYTPTIDANTVPAEEAKVTTDSMLTSLGLNVYSPTIDANTKPAEAANSITDRMLTATGNKTFTPKIDADPSQATAKVKTTEAALSGVDKSKTVPKIDADNTKATDKTKTTADSLLKLDGFTATPTITVNNSAAMQRIEATQTAINNIKGKTVTVYVNTVNTATQRAAGGIATSPQFTMFGEAGPEALVPLARPLSQVSPDVRWLSAIAQGKAGIPVGGDSTSSFTESKSRVVNIQPGAIVVQGSMAPEATATHTVNRIAERISA